MDDLQLSLAVPELQPLVAILTFEQLRAVIEKYIIDSRTGETMSYRDTAMLDSVIASFSSATKLWKEFHAAGLLATLPAVEDLASEDVANPEFVAVRPGEDLLVLDEDIAAGELCVLDGKGHARVATTEEVEASTNGETPLPDVESQPMEMIDICALFGIEPTGD